MKPRPGGTLDAHLFREVVQASRPGRGSHFYPIPGTEVPGYYHGVPLGPQPQRRLSQSSKLVVRVAEAWRSDKRSPVTNASSMTTSCASIEVSISAPGQRVVRATRMMWPHLMLTDLGSPGELFAEVVAGDFEGAIEEPGDEEGREPAGVEQEKFGEGVDAGAGENS